MQRYLFLDLAKGFTVLFIPFIHAVMLYSDPAVLQTWLGSILRFIAEWPGAELLMFVMGMSFSYSKKTSIQQAKRACLVFITGYTLNFFKFVLPNEVHLQPASFAYDLSFSHSGPVELRMFLIGDILQFAGISLLFLALIKRSRYSIVLALLLSFVVVVASPLFWDLHHSNLIIDEFLHLLGGQPSDAFFPCSPWIVYPLLGFGLGSYFQLPHASLRAVFISGLFLCAAGYSMQFLPYSFPETLFWRTYPDKTIMHIGFVLIWLSAWIWIEPYAEALRNDFPVRLLSFCGKNITVIYLLQWVVLFWLLPLVGYRHLDMGESLIVASFIYVIVFGIVILLRKRKKKPG